MPQRKKKLRKTKIHNISLYKLILSLLESISFSHKSNFRLLYIQPKWLNYRNSSAKQYHWKRQPGSLYDWNLHIPQNIHFLIEQNKMWKLELVTLNIPDISNRIKVKLSPDVYISWSESLIKCWKMAKKGQRRTNNIYLWSNKSYGKGVKLQQLFSWESLQFFSLLCPTNIFFLLESKCWIVISSDSQPKSWWNRKIEPHNILWSKWILWKKCGTIFIVKKETDFLRTWVKSDFPLCLAIIFWGEYSDTMQLKRSTFQHPVERRQAYTYYIQVQWYALEWLKMVRPILMG